ncbi:caspase-8 [Dicentrarchus labrax]|uniref:Caspase-8 n=1 Tax=Dicentrarchus labrax TaxID=13489 RepID=A0A8C4EM29_DICLA|nr:caspase-8 [Dicentrarchus labrax]
MDFQKLLLEAGKALSKGEVKALAFLCTDLLVRNPTSVDSASDLFSRLADQDYLSAERPHLLIELLLIIQRRRLLRELGFPDQVSTTIISPYRKLLYNLSEELTDDDLKDMKFLLNKQLPRKKLEENVTTLEVFLEMEHMDLISDTDLDLLRTLIQQVCPMLIEKINRFKAQQGLRSNPIAQETGRPRSVTYPSVLEQVPKSRDRTFSNEIPGFQPLPLSSINSSNISMDFARELRGRVESEAMSFGMSGLSTETSSSASSKGHQEMFSQENETSSVKVLSQTANTNTEDLGTYPMTSAKRGICLIVNNYDFSGAKNLQKREGTNIDEECLQKVFRWLGFEIQIQKDCPGEEMLSVMKEVGRRNHGQMDCLVCCFLSHGQEGGVYGVDGNLVEIRKLMDAVNGVNCSSLAEKPKLFFIQACQGNNEQKAVYIESDGPARTHVCCDAIETRESIPSDADFLLGMATVPAFVSFRERKNGTWFIQSLCQNLVQMVPRGCDLVSILTKVNADVSRKTDSTGMKKQMPQPAFTLTKKVVFPDPSHPPPNL